MSIKHFLFWLPMIAIAFANATLRELVFTKSMNELKSHQLSTITLIILCSIYVWLVFPLQSIQNSKQAFLLGFIWVLLTIAFEFSLGRLTNKTWSYLFQDYNIITGHIWFVFLLWLFFLPYMCYIIKK